MPKNEIQLIKDDLEKHGFPLEIEVSELLKKKGWNVANQYYFVDEETEKAREIDSVATKGITSYKFDSEKFSKSF